MILFSSNCNFIFKDVRLDVDNLLTILFLISFFGNVLVEDVHVDVEVLLDVIFYFYFGLCYF